MPVTRRKRREATIALVPEVVGFGEIDAEDEPLEIDTTLTIFQDRFVDELLALPPQTSPAVAAQKAQYKSPHFAAAHLLKQEKINRAIEQRRRQLKRKLHITQERVLEEYARLAFSNLKDLEGEDGEAKPLKDLDYDTAAAISHFRKKHYVDGKGGGGDPVTETEYKFYPKKEALDSLSKVLNLFGDNSKLSIDLLLSNLFKQLGESSAGELKERLVVLIAERRAKG